MKHPDLENMTHKERAKYWLGGRLRPAKVAQVIDNSLIHSHTVKIRGTHIADQNGKWKYETPEAAMEAAKKFVAWLKQVANGEREE